MKRIDLGQTIQVLANVGVIASIVFLGVQVRTSAVQVEDSDHAADGGSVGGLEGARGER
jgi:hypothetical protein